MIICDLCALPVVLSSGNLLSFMIAFYSPSTLFSTNISESILVGLCGLATQINVVNPKSILGASSEVLPVAIHSVVLYNWLAVNFLANHSSGASARLLN
jgi:hypothetical protein